MFKYDDESMTSSYGSYPAHVEEGRICFFCRPRVGVQNAQNLQDVGKFFMIMSPTSRPDPALHRLFLIGKKRLPRPWRDERCFAFVVATAQKVEELMKEYGPMDYGKSTSGQHSVDAMHFDGFLGEGVYRIVDHGSSTRLEYELDIPKEPSDVQKEFAIRVKSDYGIIIKNPNLQEQRWPTPQFPEEKQLQFMGSPWIPARDPSLLDYKNCGILLIGAQVDTASDLGPKLHKHVEQRLPRSFRALPSWKACGVQKATPLRTILASAACASESIAAMKQHSAERRRAIVGRCSWLGSGRARIW